MALLYFMVSSFPFWSLPTSYILFEVGRFHRRRRNIWKAMLSYFLCLGLIAATAFYFFDEGYNTWVPAIRHFEKDFFGT